jgi:dihydroorotase
MKITLNKPDDWHIHLREGEALTRTVYDAARQFHRVMVMPNLVNPVTTVEKAIAYKKQIMDVLQKLILQHPNEASHLENFMPLMTLYLTQNLDPAQLVLAKTSGIVHGVKLYPMGVTTLSDKGVSDITKLSAVFEQMQKLGMVLQIHGEAISTEQTEIDIFDKEKIFIETKLSYLVKTFPNLKIVLEHITTQEAVEFVLAMPKHVGATITPHHLLINRNDMFHKGIRPHYYCLPVPKRKHHQEKLLWAATSGNPKFFLGTDSAPHAQHKKENACGCAGIYSARDALAYYAMAFERAGKLDALNDFATRFGAQFYGLPLYTSTQLILEKKSQQIPERLTFTSQDEVIPFMAGQTIPWCTTR